MMETSELLANPAIQAGVIPFFLAFVLAIGLRKTPYLGLAVSAGFFAAVALTMGFSFESLTSTRKLVLVAGAAMAAVVLIESRAIAASLAWRAGLISVFSVAALWVVQRVLTQQALPAALLAACGVLAYMAALLWSGQQLREDPVQACASALLLGLTSGALALLGASAQLAQLGIAVGASAGAVLLIQMITGRRAPLGWTVGLPAQVTTGLIGLLAVFTGTLPWYGLLPTLAIAWAVRWTPIQGRTVWRSAFMCAFAALLPSLLAIALVWFTVGAAST